MIVLCLCCLSGVIKNNNTVHSIVCDVFGEIWYRKSVRYCLAHCPSRFLGRALCFTSVSPFTFQCQFFVSRISFSSQSAKWKIEIKAERNVEFPGRVTHRVSHQGRTHSYWNSTRITKINKERFSWLKARLVRLESRVGLTYLKSDLSPYFRGLRTDLNDNALYICSLST